MNPKDFTRIVRDRGDPIEADVAADIIDDLANQGETLEAQLAQLRRDLDAAVVDRNAATARLQEVDEKLCKALNERDVLRVEKEKAEALTRRAVDVLVSEEMDRDFGEEPSARAMEVRAIMAECGMTAEKCSMGATIGYSGTAAVVRERDELGIQLRACQERLRLAEYVIATLRADASDASADVEALRRWDAVPGDALATSTATAKDEHHVVARVDLGTGRWHRLRVFHAFDEATAYYDELMAELEAAPKPGVFIKMNGPWSAPVSDEKGGAA